MLNTRQSHVPDGNTRSPFHTHSMVETLVLPQLSRVAACHPVTLYAVDPGLRVQLRAHPAAPTIHGAAHGVDA
ncbi:hypothetical protein [Streptomyces sp. NPDC048361]|uniref:hypothetical protein n=1 Tax=Streptomyces sp. NPDC048361 TaxID=3154720 RepID=UPI0034374E70